MQTVRFSGTFSAPAKYQGGMKRAVKTVLNDTHSVTLMQGVEDDTYTISSRPSYSKEEENHPKTSEAVDTFDALLKNALTAKKIPFKYDESPDADLSSQKLDDSIHTTHTSSSAQSTSTLDRILESTLGRLRFPL
jgi:hypothetical protein